ncbi:MAG: energy transducer TonB [Flavobacterium sp.]|uniref:energy transducer TonB n=1 Tax=Flavobacterium sp. TaxID=239 RepID=UPI0022CA091F|nr:energy transducer TonB [Flavobacterium sp.]MCZ8331536.1 energy transducer TonB [Flavobacterium sp.]
MSNVSIYEKNWIDLVFEGKNQEYGAYQLRKENSKTTLLSLFYGTLLVGGFIASFVIFNLKSDVPVTTPTEIIDELIRVTTFKIPETEREPIRQLPTEKTQETQVEPTNLSNMVVSETNVSVDVPTNENMTTHQPTTDTGSGTGTQDGTGQSTTATVGATSGGETIKGSYTSVELDKLPEFPGGIEKFYQYVGKNFEKPEQLETGTVISVLVAFVIEKDGSMTDIKVLRNPGYGLGNEAIRVLKSLKTKWSAGMKNGKNVRTEYVLPIKVKID